MNTFIGSWLAFFPWFPNNGNNTNPRNVQLFNRLLKNKGVTNCFVKCMKMKQKRTQMQASPCNEEGRDFWNFNEHNVEHME